MTSRVVWTGPAAKDLRALDDQTARRVLDAVERLAASGHGDLKKLKGRSDEWRLRVGDHRVIFSFDHPAGIIFVRRVRHRRDAYLGG